VSAVEPRGHAMVDAHSGRCTAKLLSLAPSVPLRGRTAPHALSCWTTGQSAAAVSCQQVQLQLAVQEEPVPLV